jgi:hypothetical protein
MGGGARQVPCVPKTVILDINPEQVDWCLVDAREAFEEEKERSAWRPSSPSNDADAQSTAMTDPTHRAGAISRQDWVVDSEAVAGR